MLSAPIGPLLRSARERIGMSRAALASSTQVSERLLAELERGQRPNVSLETSLKLLEAVGISLRLADSSGAIVEIRAPSAESLERKERASYRRQTWTGGHAALHGKENDPLSTHSLAGRVFSVAHVSRQAYAIAAAVQEAQPRAKYMSPEPQPTPNASRSSSKRRTP